MVVQIVPTYSITSVATSPRDERYCVSSVGIKKSPPAAISGMTGTVYFENGG